MDCDQQRLAAAFYSAIMLGQAIAFNLVLWWSHWQKLCYEIPLLPRQRPI